MKISLVDDWGAVLRKAWSIKLILFGGLLVGLEAVTQIMSAFHYLPEWMPPGVFLGLSFLCNAGAFVARIVNQKGLSDGQQ